MHDARGLNYKCNTWSRQKIAPTVSIKLRSRYSKSTADQIIRNNIRISFLIFFFWVILRNSKSTKDQTRRISFFNLIYVFWGFNLKCAFLGI